MGDDELIRKQPDAVEGMRLSGFDGPAILRDDRVASVVLAGLAAAGVVKYPIVNLIGAAVSGGDTLVGVVLSQIGLIDVTGSFSG